MAEQRFLGTFGSTGTSSEHYGELTVNGADTALRLIGHNLASIKEAEVIYGQTTRGKVSCIGCVSTGAGWAFNGGPTGEQAKIFPHYVIHGPLFFDPDVDAVERMTFRFTDIDVLFGQSGSVGSFIAASGVMESVLAAVQNGKAVVTGETPVLSYYDGQAEVWGLHTAIGKVSVWNVIEFDALRPFTHRLEMSIAFDTPLSFKESVERLLSVRQCMTTIAGRAQRLEAISLTPHSADAVAANKRHRLLLDWPLSPPGSAESDFPPRGFALPVDPLRRPDEFSSVLTGWFARDDVWHWPRARYVQCIENGRHYTTDRLVAAANMFDLLADSSYPPQEALTPEVAEAAAQARALFRALPNSIERSSVLGTIGRLGKLSLPKKVAHRGYIVQAQFSTRLSSLQKVLKAAVECRNHFVHGSDFDLDAVDPYFDMITDTLEFVFVASDLIELGWKAADWANSPNSGGHRFAEFLHTYAASINGFVDAYEGRTS